MIKFVDLNNSLVEKVKALGIESVYGDYFMEAYRTERPVLMTASNPMFTFGGGLDYIFTKHFPELCRFKQMKGGGMERIGNVVFAITVDEKLKATKEKVEEAIRFSLENTYEGETLVLSGVGTGIGGLSENDFISVIKNIWI